MVSEPGAPQPVINQVTKEKIQVAIHLEYLEQTVAISSTLTEEGRKELCELLRRSLDVFSWQPSDMTGVPRWLSNPVMVKKHDNSWRMCVDFKDLNKACPKDGYPLLKIDWKVESLCGLKNAGATYQRLVDKAFQKQIGRNLEVYVDDLVIKSRTEEEVIQDMEETFKTLREINMKLNPKKCAFVIKEGTFLGYKVDADGLRVCLDKVEAVLNLQSPRCLKDVQKLNGKLASLNRFLSKSAKKSLPFFKTLKKCTKKSDFLWTVEAEEAFRQMKQSIAELPTLAAPKEKEELIMYLAAAKEAISAVLMTERDRKQMPVYFISRALQGPEINYTSMENLILALVSASKRFELEEYDIQYRPRTSVKGQILADFIAEHPEDDMSDTPIKEREELSKPWILFTDGSSCIDGSGFKATNNEAEYEALIAGLRIAGQMGARNLQTSVDLKLIANQVNGTYVAKEPNMVKYLEKVKNLASTFQEFTIKQVPRGENKKADALSKIASTSFAHLSKQVLVEELKNKSIDEQEVLAVVKEEGYTWMTPVHEYLMEGVLPEEKKKARAIRCKASRYTMINEVLYKKSFLGLWLRCVGPLKVNYVLREIHKGSCSMHSGPRSIVAKALRLGYYWPTMHLDARNLIKECSDCQVHRPMPKSSQEKLTPITSPWPFHKWGIDIAGPFPEGPGKVKFLIVAIDYFTKWMEAKPVATITRAQVKKFVWDNVVCRFGLPGEIIIMIKSSNGETPFSLTYGTEAVIPVEIGVPTLRTAEVDIIKNNEDLEINLDLVEEKREQATIQEARSKAKMEKYYNARVRGRCFCPKRLCLPK
ncbi:reverse transcriptase domain-containing protein [Tanacetum coccineum]|uniref:Reverse transcriptase domain-containing protein n=1 Tax=Tanacetum coccineum TaxID=301880 RepID=A0ABQ5I5J6_9ASTR